MTTLNIVTYNIHKGFSHFNRRMVLHELRDQLRLLDADIVFLQEVQGANDGHERRFTDYPKQPQYEFLADQIWPHHAYGKNAVHDLGHHGNAILSRYPIARWDNQNVSAHRFESRSLLHCEIPVAGSSQPVHCICVHFGLFAHGRRSQFSALVKRIGRLVPADAPLIVAGDFNDWHDRASHFLAQELKLVEVFIATSGKPARTFPVAMPLLRMDRIYVRGFNIQKCAVLARHPWNKISDHAALSASLVLP